MMIIDSLLKIKCFSLWRGAGEPLSFCLSPRLHAKISRQDHPGAAVANLVDQWHLRFVPFQACVSLCLARH
jgi:hypothetical protein